MFNEIKKKHIFKIFKNIILIIAFNYSNSLKNKDKLINIYKNHFKDIIVYSDYPVEKRY